MKRRNNENIKFWLSLFDFGKIKILPEDGKIYNIKTKRNMGYISNSGYMLSGWKNNKSVIHILNHRLIWSYVHGIPDDELEINHKDGIKTNNSIKNLELVTGSENVNHAFKNGLVDTEKIAETLTKYYNNYFLETGKRMYEKICFSDIKEVIRLRNLDEKKYTYRKLANMYNISHSTLLRLMRKYK